MATNQSLTQALKTYFGFDKFKGNQEAIITSLIDGHDTFVLMPTGGGKSLCYQLPALIMDGAAIVISPLIALMKNQVDAIRNFVGDDSIAHFLNSSLTRAAIDQVKDDVRAGRTRLLYVAPESLTKEENIEFLKTVPISFYAIDEAHCISEWGHDFRPEYRRIRPIINQIGTRPVIALTATATPKVQHDIQKNLGMTDARVFKASFNRPNLYYEVRPKTKNVDRDIIRFIKSQPGRSGIIYCLSRKKVEELAELLNINDIKALPYHAGMDGVTRSDNQDAFLMERVNVIVATIAFGMGIDKPDVRFVIHYDMPKSLEGYYQETGRAGRDGGEGYCLTFYSAKDLRKIEKFMQSKPIAEQEIGRQLLLETAAYAESSVCRRLTLLHYFGEAYNECNCGNCDNCRHPRKKVDATNALLCIIDAIHAVRTPFRSEHIVDVVRGRVTADIKSYGHEKLEEFGCGSEYDGRFLSAAIRQAIIAGYLERDIENFGLISVTPKGEEFLAHRSTFSIVEDNDFSQEEEEAGPTGGTCALDPTLFSMLRGLRAKLAARAKLPPYVIFQDPSLEAMATMYPVTDEELLNIPGVGTGKARRYGKEFLDLIRNYVVDNEIERPEDMRVRSVPNNSLKISLIQAVDRKIALDELAVSKGMDMLKLLDELESIVYSGTKIDISYYVDEVLDEDLQEEIYDYFRNSDTDAMSAALEEFEDEYTEEELRMMRIKFLSEFAN
ncbi:MAG: DNA helicase RecQ [Bacteroidales bacterium]|nr:DNA helicase RecQ [Bacteroidales bacterium]MDY2916814.1 DNA helicase RecQ [Muribaculaceae bacterium]